MESRLLAFPHEGQDLRNYSLPNKQVLPEPSKSAFQNKIPSARLLSKDEQKYSFEGQTVDTLHPHILQIVLKEPFTPLDLTQLSQQQEKLDAMVNATLKKEQSPKLKLPKKGPLSKTERRVIESGRQERVAHGYILMGIAKPSATANSTFDMAVQLGGCGVDRAKGEQEGDQSFMEEMNKEVCSLSFERMHQSWLRKWQSFEYLKFMSRIYLQLKGQGLSPKEIEGQLYYNQQGLNLLFISKEEETLSISDQDYYRYFCDLLHQHSQQITQQLQEVPPLKGTNYYLQLDTHQLALSSINYEARVSALFADLDLSPESLASMAASQQRRDRAVIEGLVWQTRAEKMSTLRKLQNKQSAFYHEVQLLPLQDADCGECSNYLVVVKGLPKPGPEGTASLQQIIQDAVNKHTREADREFALAKLSLFQTMIAQKRALQGSAQLNSLSGASFILDQFSMHPQYISIDSQNRTELCFQEVLEKSLRLHTLPLSHEQQMLSMTPNENVDMHSILLELMQSVHPPSSTTDKWSSLQNYYNDLCRSLSSDNLTFCLRKGGGEEKSDLSGLKEEYSGLDARLQKERIRIKSESQLQRMTNIIQLLSDDYVKFTRTCAKYISRQERLKLLLISIMEYEVKFQEKCLLSQKLRGGSSQKRQFCRHQPSEQKEAFQMALLMLICSGAVNHIECKQLVGTGQETLDHYVHNLSRIKILIEEYFLRNYQLYLRHLHQSVTNKDQYNLIQTPEKCFLSMVETFQRLLPPSSNINRALLKAAFLLHLEESHLSLVSAILDIPETLKKMLLLGGSEDPEEYEEGLQLVKECLQDSYAKRTHQILNSSLYRSIQLSWLLEKEEQFQVEGLMAVVQDVESRRSKIEESFTQDTRQRSLEKLILQVKELSTKLQSKVSQKYTQNQLIQLAKSVLLQDQTKDKSLREVVEERQAWNRKGLALIFCQIYHSRAQIRKNTMQRGIEEEMQEEDQRTLDLLCFFLGPSRVVQGLGRGEEVRFWVGQCCSAMERELGEVVVE